MEYVCLPGTKRWFHPIQVKGVHDSSVLPVEDGDAGRWPHVMFDESELAGGDAGRWFVLALCLPDLLNFDIVSR